MCKLIDRSAVANKYTQEELRLMKTQDIKYVDLKAQLEARVNCSVASEAQICFSVPKALKLIAAATKHKALYFWCTSQILLECPFFPIAWCCSKEFHSA